MPQMSQPPPGPYGGYGGGGQPPQGPGGGPYGAWPPPPPPRRGLGAGAVTAIVLGGVVVLAALVAGIGLVAGVDGGTKGTMKLTTPRTLDNGRYHRIPPTPGVERQEEQLQEELPSDGKARIASYSTDGSGDPLAGALVLSGAYGDIDVASATMRDDMLDGVRQSARSQLVGERREFRPQGAEGPEISCQLEKIDEGGVTLYSPACAWADASTAAVLLEIKAENTAASRVDLAEFAALTARIKDEATVPK